jgi:hypothetical protein
MLDRHPCYSFFSPYFFFSTEIIAVDVSRFERTDMLQVFGSTNDIQDGVLHNGYRIAREKIDFKLFVCEEFDKRLP